MTPIQELESRCAAGQSIAIEKSIKLWPKRREDNAAQLSDLKPGDILREKETGHRWTYNGPSERSGCVRVVTDGGVSSMDMSMGRLYREKEGEKEATEACFNAPVVVFSVARGDDPNDPKFRKLIGHVMEVRKQLDSAKTELHRPDPDLNLRATTWKKVASRKNQSNLSQPVKSAVR